MYNMSRYMYSYILYIMYILNQYINIVYEYIKILDFWCIIYSYNIYLPVPYPGSASVIIYIITLLYLRVPGIFFFIHFIIFITLRVHSVYLYSSYTKLKYLLSCYTGIYII